MQRLDKALLVDAQQVSFDIDTRATNLELIADKAAELRLMIEAALDPLDMSPDIDWLKAEVERFKLACKGVRA
jgi:hypothetical protein